MYRYNEENRQIQNRVRSTKTDGSGSALVIKAMQLRDELRHPSLDPAHLLLASIDSKELHALRLWPSAFTHAAAKRKLVDIFRALDGASTRTVDIFRAFDIAEDVKHYEGRRTLFVRDLAYGSIIAGGKEGKLLFRVLDAFGLWPSRIVEKFELDDTLTTRHLTEMRH
jgi:hypothetical protein